MLSTFRTSLPVVLILSFFRSNPGVSATCITSCMGLTSGNYQSCNGCNVYATCTNGMLINDRPCPATTYWDDMMKACVYISTTCFMCVNSCSGMADGDYNSCISCSVYATCSSGTLHDNRPCPGSLLFNAIKQQCDYTTPTCA